MKRVAVLFLFLFCLTACVWRDNFPGEPCVRLEYTVNGERVTYEDWGGWQSGLFSKSYRPRTEGSGLTLSSSGNQGVASFVLYNGWIKFRASSDRAYFLDSKRYPCKDAEILLNCKGFFYKPLDGWYCFTRNTSEPYCRYDVHFEFTAEGPNETYVITDGVLQVGRRFQSAEVKNLIKSSE